MSDNALERLNRFNERLRPVMGAFAIATIAFAFVSLGWRIGLLVLASVGGGLLVGRFPEILRIVVHLVWPFVSLAAALAVTAILPNVTKRTGNGAFYEAAAQIIPVLILALAITLRFGEKRDAFPADAYELAFAVGGAVVLGLGEFDSLQSIARGSGGSHAFAAACAAMTYGFLAVLLAAIGRYPGESPPS
jgi:hypothetical protein